MSSQDLSSRIEAFQQLNTHIPTNHLNAHALSLSPLPVLTQLPLSEMRLFTGKITKICTEFLADFFFNGFSQFPSPFNWLPHLRAWTKEAWRAGTKATIDKSILKSYSWKWDERRKFYLLKSLLIYSIMPAD